MYNVLTKDGLIITGDPGVGKSTLAKIIAGSRGEYITTSIDEWSNRRFSPDGVDKVRTVIVEEFNPTPKNIVLAKSLITSQLLEVNFKFRRLFKIKMPHFIFVTNAPLVVASDRRRFKVIALHAPSIIDNDK